MKSRRLALFDLDNTLLSGDSDEEWLNFLIDEGVLDRQIEEAANADFARRYRDGSVATLDYIRFYLRLLVPYEMDQLIAWRKRFLRERIAPRIPPAARDLLAQHRDDLVVIITATNRFLTEPIATEFGVENLIATEPEMKNGRFTGDVSGTPSFREGKVVRVNEWLGARGQSMGDFSETWFYSDSINDAPLLGAVSHPFAVDPGAQLETLALERGWPILRLQR